MKIDDILEACAEQGQDAGITIEAQLEPLEGTGAPIKPASYEGGRYQVDRRWWSVDGQMKDVNAVVVDNVPSQANRYEAVLEELRAEAGLPEIVLDLSGISTLPPHLPKRLSSFKFPHRNADAYLRDADLDGTKFMNTPEGKAIFAATADAPWALLQWFPQALLYGFWQSHLGKKRTQAKLARSWTSEIVGYHPAAPEPNDAKAFGMKGDSLNLAAPGTVEYRDDDLVGNDWTYTAADRAKAKGKATEALSNVGHGQVLAEASAAPLSFAGITQRSTVSFASLRRLHTGDPSADAAGRALLVAMGLMAHTAAFGRAFSLRSRCDLRPKATTWTWLGAAGDEAMEQLTLEQAKDLFRESVAQAESAGLPVGSQWASEPLVLEPNSALHKAIRASWPLED